MVEQLHAAPDIFRVDVCLPDSPLKNLNCYVIRTPGENLVIDTGFNRPECLQALLQGLDELGLELRQTTLFLTHLHSDHIGLAEDLYRRGVQVVMSRIDHDYFRRRDLEDNWGWMEQAFIRQGLSPELVEEQRKVNPARAYAPGHGFTARTLEDGDTLTVGPWALRCILTPGHSPGHMCLYLEAEKILFCGDHILFNISPNITMWRHIRDSLGDYLDSLKRIRTLDIRLALPAHRQNDMDVYVRIDQLLEHHRFRLDQIIGILGEEPGLNACQIGARMRWRMRGKAWDDFPIQQKWFAIGETVAHLDHLLLRGAIVCREEEGVLRYFLP